MECSHMPAPSRQEFLLEKILEQLVILNNRLEPKQDSNAIMKQNLMHAEDVSVPEDEKKNIYKYLEDDNMISTNTKVTYKKHRATESARKSLLVLKSRSNSSCLFVAA